jgi:hypothetical protein
MNVKKLLALAIIVSVYTAQAQSDFIILGNRQYDVVERLEVLLKNDTVLNLSSIKPYSRKIVTERLENALRLANEGKLQLSQIDRYNIEMVLKDNFEYRSGYGDSVLKIKDIFSKKVFNNPAYIGIKQGDFSAYITPYLRFGRGNDNNLPGDALFTNVRGVGIRGTITKGVGYYGFLFENQERAPLYVQQYQQRFNAVPGEGYYKSGYRGNGYDIFNARGGIMFKAAKGIDMQFAFDKVFIGNGYRSLILSDFSNNQLFLKINARFWKMNYHLHFAQLVDQFPPGPDGLRPRKFMAYHQVNILAKKWLDIGFYENVMFSRSNGSFDLTYLNPLIFYRAAEIQNGSPDKVTMGINAKANPFKNTQLYMQFVLNEFVLGELTNPSRGSNRNKYAFQLGAKMMNVAGIRNLDVQAEYNFIRPFTYQHWDSSGTFTHYNQELAHPMGAGLREFIGIVRYQPIKKLLFTARLIHTYQGQDSAGLNFGANPRRIYIDAPRQTGFFVGSGIAATTVQANIMATYELLPNLFIDANYAIRNVSRINAANFNTTMYNVTVRLNMGRREFEF